MKSSILIFTSLADEKSAQTLGRKLVEEKLAACVSILPKAVSIYRWENNIQEDTEYLLLIKTHQALFPAIEAFFAEHHPYEVPECLSIAIEKGSAAYLNWLTQALK